MTQGAPGFTGQVGAQGVNGSRVRLRRNKVQSSAVVSPELIRRSQRTIFFTQLNFCLSFFKSFSEGEMGAAGVAGHKGPQVHILGQIICIHSYIYLFLLPGFG